MRSLLLAVLLALSASCGPPPPPVPPDPAPAPEAPPDPPPPEASDCASGCSRLKELGCREAEGSTPSDPESCRKDCEYVETQGMVRLNAACWSTLSSCDDLGTRCGGAQ